MICTSPINDGKGDKGGVLKMFLPQDAADERVQILKYLQNTKQLLRFEDKQQTKFQSGIYRAFQIFFSTTIITGTKGHFFGRHVF